MSDCKYKAPNGEKSELYNNVLQEYGHKIALDTYITANSDFVKNQYGNTIKLDNNREPTIEWIKDNNLIINTENEVLPVKRKDALLFAKIQAKLAKLDIPLIYREDAKLSVPGEIKNSNGTFTITINPELQKKETLIHELGHVLIESLPYNGEMIQQGIFQLSGSKLESDMKKLYPDLDLRQFNKELLTTAVSVRADQLFTEQSKKSSWQLWLNSFFRKIADKLGSNKDIIETLAHNLIDAKIYNNINIRTELNAQHRADFRFIDKNITNQIKIIHDARNTITLKLKLYFKEHEISATYDNFIGTQDALDTVISKIEDRKNAINLIQNSTNIPENKKAEGIEAVNELIKKDLRGGFLQFLENSYSNITALEQRIADIKNPIYNNEIDVETVSMKTLKKLLNYLSSYEIIQEIQKEVIEDKELQDFIKDAGQLETLKELQGRITKIKLDTIELAKLNLGDRLARMGRGRKEAETRRDLETKYDKENDKKIGTIVQLDGLSKRYNRDQFLKDRAIAVNNQIDAMRDRIYLDESKHYVDLLTKGSRDISWASTYLLGADSADDDLIQTLTETLDSKDYDTQHVTDQAYRDYAGLFKDLQNKVKSSDVFTLYDKMLEHEWLHNEDGTITKNPLRRSQHIVNEYHSQFKLQYDELHRDYENKLGNSEFTDEDVQKAYSKYLKFKRENTVQQYNKEYTDVLDSLPIAERRLLKPILNKRKFILNKYAKQYINKKDVIFDSSVLPKTIRAIYDKNEAEFAKLLASNPVVNKNYSEYADLHSTFRPGYSRVKLRYANDVQYSDIDKPIDKWLNPQYTELLKEELKGGIQLNGLDEPTFIGSEEWKMYKASLTGLQEDDKALPVWAKSNTDYRYRGGRITNTKLPSSQKENAERFGTEGVVGGLTQNIKNSFVRKTSTDYGGEQAGDTRESIADRTSVVAANEKGDTRFSVPIYFRYANEYENQSFDVPSLMVQNRWMTTNYANKTDIKEDMEMARDLIGLREVPKVKSNGMFSGLNKLQQDLSGTRADVLEQSSQNVNQSNAYKLMTGIVENRIYGIKSRTNKQADRVTKLALNYTSQVFLGFNYLSAGVNYVAGTWNLRLQSAGGMDFNRKKLKAGRKIYAGDLLAVKQDAANEKGYQMFNLLRDKQNFIQRSRTNVLMEQLNIHQGNQPINRRYSADNMAKQYLNSDLGGFMHNAGEHAITGEIMYAILLDVKLLNEVGQYVTATGTTEDESKALTLNDVLKARNGVMIIDAPTHAGNLRMSEYNLPLNKQSLKVVSRKIADLRASSQGQYAESKTPLAKMYFYAKLVFSMRGWLPETYRQRLLGISTVGISRKDLKSEDMFYSRAKGHFQEGTYTSAIRASVELTKTVYAIRKELWYNKARLTQLKNAYGDVMNEYSRMEVANIRRACWELGSIITLAVLSEVFAHFRKELPKDGIVRPTSYFLLFLAMRMRNELLGYINPLEQWRNVKSLSASMDIIDSVGKFTEQLIHPLEVYKTGKLKGHYKLMNKFNHAFPYINQINRNVEDTYGYLIGDKSKTQ